MPYHTTLHSFGFHNICSQHPTPVLSASAYFNKFVVLVRTYSVHVFPVFFPHTQTRYKCVFLFIACDCCLSQFYCWNPRAPVSVVVFVFVCSHRDAAAHHRGYACRHLYKSSPFPSLLATLYWSEGTFTVTWLHAYYHQGFSGFWLRLCKQLNYIYH